MTRDEILEMYVEEDRPFLHFEERGGSHYMLRNHRKLLLLVADSKQAIAIFNYEHNRGWVEATAPGTPISGRRIPEGFSAAIERWGGRDG